MKVELFVIGKDRLVELNKTWITTIKEFKKIVTRDKGSDGDADGRRKLQAIKEFTFIYHFCDYRSQFINYGNLDREIEAIRNSDLPPDFKYEKDSDLLEAVARYQSFQKSPALKVLEESREGLHSAHKVIKHIRESLEKRLSTATFKAIDTEATVDDTEIITNIAKGLKSLMELTTTIGPALKNIKNLEEEVKLELGDKQELRGDKELGHREDPEGNTPMSSRVGKKEVDPFDEL